MRKHYGSAVYNNTHLSRSNKCSIHKSALLNYKGKTEPSPDVKQRGKWTPIQSCLGLTQSGYLLSLLEHEVTATVSLSAKCTGAACYSPDLLPCFMHCGELKAVFGCYSSTSACKCFYIKKDLTSCRGDTVAELLLGVHLSYLQCWCAWYSRPPPSEFPVVVCGSPRYQPP